MNRATSLPLVLLAIAAALPAAAQESGGRRLRSNPGNIDVPCCLTSASG